MYRGFFFFFFPGVFSLLAARLAIDFVIAIRQDAQDPDFQSMLRAVGTVQQIPDPAQKAPQV